MCKKDKSDHEGLTINEILAGIWSRTAQMIINDYNLYQLQLEFAHDLVFQVILAQEF